MWLSARNEARRLMAMNTKPRLYQRLAFNLIVAVVIGVCFGARPGVAQSTDPSMVGEWSTANPDPFPIFPVHAHLLPTGKVMIWPGDRIHLATIHDPGIPRTQSISTLASPGYDVFCAGHSFLADGRLFVAGGNNPQMTAWTGERKYLQPHSNTWTPRPGPGPLQRLAACPT